MINYQKRLINYQEQQRWGSFKRFLQGFKFPYLVKIVNYYSLPCADIRQQRCIYKSIKEAKLTYQDIWRAVIND